MQRAESGKVGSFEPFAASCMNGSFSDLSDVGQCCGGKVKYT